MKRNFIVGIDASRCKSGGARAHILAVIKSLHYVHNELNISKVVIWSYSELLFGLPDFEWLQKRNPSFLERSLPFQLFWQRFCLHSDLRAERCDILLTLDGSSVSNFAPNIVMSRDLLSYDEGISRLYSFGWRKLRIHLIKYLQNYAFSRSDAIVFLTEYAKEKILSQLKNYKGVKVIPHGFDSYFLNTHKVLFGLKTKSSINLLYISNAEPYKHQLEVIDAVNLLRKKNYPVTLTLVGGGAGTYQKKVQLKINEVDPDRVFIKQIGFISRKELPFFYGKMDIFIFASSCEAFGITLLEAMSSGIPIACSNASSLPQLALDGVQYFNPYDSISIMNGIEILINDDMRRAHISERAVEIAKNYSWDVSAKMLFEYIIQIAKKYEKTN
jgi:glycosyltransferase involved in cell wall biosynthesis